MKKAILSFCLFVLSSLAYASPHRLFVEGEVQPGEVRIEVREGKLWVNGGEGLTAEIYDVAGNRVAIYKIDSVSKSISIELGKGFYMVRVGEVVRRVYLS